MIGSCNYTHKLSRRAVDRGDGWVSQGRRSGGEKERWICWKRGALRGWLFSIFFPLSPSRSLLWVCIMWWCVIGLWSHQSCANRLAGKHVSLRGCRGECVCCVNHRCGIVWEMVWWSKSYINGEQVGQLTLSQTNLLSWVHRECLELLSLCTVAHAYWIQTHSIIYRVSFGWTKLNYVLHS